ncbi:MAG: hypothetical protein E6H84_11955 [Chloroflexi bacterium]|nr:MAG: hypothetical protein E6H84_11955 [Chloroflexota bacterium]
MAHGAVSPVAIAWTFSTTAGPRRGLGVGVAFALAGGAAVGIGIVVVRGDVPAGANAHDAMAKAERSAARRLTRA